MKKVAIVVQRYGEGFAGGAEYLAYLYAQKLKEFCEVTVLTSCARDYLTWENSFPEGEMEQEGITLRRFKTPQARDFDQFSRTSYLREINGHNLSEEGENRYFEEQGPWLPDLVNYLKDHYDDFHSFIFFTYLYYPTVAGIPAVADKSYLVATAHDEPPFYFIRSLSKIFSSIKGIIYLTQSERQLIQRFYPLPKEVKSIPGAFGIEPPLIISDEEEQEYRIKYHQLVERPYFLYVGRINQGKGVSHLIHAFTEARNRAVIDVRLGFIGSLEYDLVERDEVKYWGFASEREKSFLLANALALVQPSSFESLSLVCLDALNHRTPIIVNGACSVTRDLVQASRGGLYYHSEAVFTGVMQWAMEHFGEMKILGLQGQEYIGRYYNWDYAEKQMIRQII